MSRLVPDFPLTSSPPPSDPTRTLQVIGAGYSRTATVSFTMALEKLLKGPVCHTGSASLLREEGFMKNWLIAMSPKSSQDSIKQALRENLQGYVAMTDNPGAKFVEELVELYPDALVICTIRDPETWFLSLRNLVKGMNKWWLEVIFSIMPVLRFFGTWRRAMAYRTRVIYPEAAALPEGETLYGTYGKGMLEIHHNYLKRVVPSERLFFFDVKDGWAPLCKILNCPIPDEPFPHANDKAALGKAFRAVIMQAVYRWIQIISISFAFLGIGIYMRRK